MSCDHNFWYTCVIKWWYLQWFVSFFFILIFWAVTRVKWKKTAKNSPKRKITITSIICHMLGTVQHMIMILVHFFKMMIYPQGFFIFSKFCFWVFALVVEWKKFCLLCFISQKPYIIWLSFMVHLCKVMISSEVFFSFFQNFDGGRGA